MKRSKAKIRRAYENGEKPFKNQLKVRTVAPVWRTDKGYAAYVCTATPGKKHNQCAETAFGSTPTRAVAKAYALYAKMLRQRARETTWS